MRVQAAFTEAGLLHRSLRRASAAAAITLDQDKGPSTRAAYTLTALAVENFGRLGKGGSDLIERPQVAASIVGGADGSSL